MSCEKIEALFFGYLDQELDQEETASVQAHLGQCPHCTKKFEEIKQLRNVVSEKVFPDATFFDEARRKLFQRIRESRSSREFVLKPSLRRRWIPVLVSVIAAVLLISLLILPGRDQKRVLSQEETMKEDLVELVLLEETPSETLLGLESEEVFLEEELAMMDEFIVLVEASAAEEMDLEDELLLLQFLGEEVVDEEWEDLEEELAFIEEELG